MKEIKREQEGYCGPAVLQDIIHQEGMFATQSEIADACRTTNKDGTSHLGLLMGARELGLKVFKIVGLPIEEYKDLLKANHVVVNWMDGTDEESDGHYSLLEKVEDGKVYLHDYTFTTEEFDKKWYDIDRGQRVNRWAMLVHKTKMQILIGYEIVKTNFKHHLRKTFRPIYKDLGKSSPQIK